MAHIPFVKMIATMAPCLLKETILSKLSNFVHTFNVDVTNKPFNDTHRKYINTVMKLNNSKTIMLETRGEEVLIQNTENITLKKGEKINVEFSKLREEESDTIFVNYQHLDEVPVEAKIMFRESEVLLEVVESEEGILTCKVQEGGTILPQTHILFEEYRPRLSFLSERDKKNVVRGLQSGINVIAASAVKTAAHVQSIKEFLEDNQGEGIKVFVRLHTKDAYEYIDDIIDISDGILYTPGMYKNIAPASAKENDTTIVERIKSRGKPCICSLDKETYKKVKKKFTDFLHEYIDMGVDAFMVSEDFVGEEALQDEIISIYEQIQDIDIKEVQTHREKNFSEYAIQHEHVQNYIIHKAYTAAKELPIKTIVCYTETGSAIAKLGALRNTIPLVVFTKSDPVYRYINNLRGVKAFKISQSFNYESFKRIGKEMIRILFKGNISLEDKILIMQVREEGANKERSEDMVNGIELYKFKNI